MDQKVRKKNLFIPNRGMRTFFARQSSWRVTGSITLWDYLEDSTLSQNPHFRSDFWKQLNLACYHGNEEIINFIMEHPQININNRRNDAHLNMLGSAFFGRKEWVVLRLLDHPNLDINKHVLEGYCYMCNNKLVHPLVQALKFNMYNAVAKILAMPSLDINNLSRNFHPSQTQMEIHSDSGKDSDLWYGKFTILEEILCKKKNNFVTKQLLERDGIEINDRMYILATVGNNVEALKWLHEKKPMTHEITDRISLIETCFEKSFAYASYESFDYLRTFYLEAEFSEKVNRYVDEFLEYFVMRISESSDDLLHFFDRIYEFLTDKQRVLCFKLACDVGKEEFLLAYIQKNKLPLETFSSYDSKNPSYSLRKNVLPRLLKDEMYQIASYVVKVLFEKPQSLGYYQNLLFKMYKQVINSPSWADEEEIHRGGGIERYFAKRADEKHFIYNLNSKCINQYKTYIQAFSEIDVLTKNPYLPTDVRRHILKFIAKKKFLTKAHFREHDWVHYAIAYVEDLEPEYLFEDEII